MSDLQNFEQISINPGFMKHNGGLFFRALTKIKFQFKTKITKKHLNKAGITHGGYIASIIDAGAGTAVHRVSDNKICVTISLDIKFIGSSKFGDQLIGDVKIIKTTKTLVFVNCILTSKKDIIATASGVWKKTNKSF